MSLANRVIPIGNIYRLVFVGSLLLTVLATASATNSGTVTVTTTDVNASVAPGENATVATYEVAARNTTATLTDVSVSGIPFATTVTPETAVVNASCDGNVSDTGGQCPWVNQTVTVTASVPTEEPPALYEGVTVFGFADRNPVEAAVLVNVTEQVNWSVVDIDLDDAVNVSSDGGLGAFTVDNNGNTERGIDVNVTGNISEILQTDASLTVHRGGDREVPVTYQVRSDATLGTYTGTITLTDRDADWRDAVNVSVAVVDTVPPTIEDLQIAEEVEASLPVEWTVLVSDNYEMESVAAAVVREEPRPVGNDTEVVNVSVANLSFDATEYTDQWDATFEETAALGQYYVQLTAADTSGNEVRETVPFEVVKLDAVTVQDTDLEFESQRPDPDDAMTAPVFELHEAVPVNITLTDFQEFGAEDTVSVGIRETGATSRETLEPDGSVVVSEPGVYELVVRSDTEAGFEGTLHYHVSNHVEIASTGFSGQFLDQECPPEAERVRGDRVWQFEYTDDDCVAGEYELTVTGPGEDCLGFESFWECVNVRGLDMERMDRLETERDTEARSATRWRRAGLGSVAVFLFLSVFMMALRRAEGTMAIRYAPKKSSIDVYQQGEG